MLKAQRYEFKASEDATVLKLRRFESGQCLGGRSPRNLLYAALIVIKRKGECKFMDQNLYYQIQQILKLQHKKNKIKKTQAIKTSSRNKIIQGADKALIMKNLP